MKREGYKRLGEYIAPYLEKNVGRKVTLSQGINNNKYFQTPRQVAVDSENDQIVRTGQFAYNKATTRNGDKISIAYREGPDCTVSSAYQVFYIKDEERLNPHYLLMWFKRPEFDRYARFKSFGSAHEFFTWEEMCNVYLPIPDIAEQRRIVAEYQAVEQRIENNNRLIKTLEATAQAIYHHTFVENIDPENLPEGWRMGCLSDIARVNMGQSPEGECLNTKGDGEIFYQGRTDFGVRFPDVRVYTTDAKKHAKEYDILMSVRAPVGDLNITRKACAIGRGIAAITPKNGRCFVFYTLLNQTAQFKKSNDEGTIFGSIGKDELNDLKVLVPKDEVINEFNEKVEKLDMSIDSVDLENSVLYKVKDLLLCKLS